MDLSVDLAWVIGLLLAMTRVTGFAVSAVVLAKALPVPGRMAFVLAVSLFLARPTPGVGALGDLIGLAVTNAGMGLALGFLTGLLFHAFATAGELIDVSANLSLAAVFDPSSGEQSAVISRLFTQAAIALFAVGGGLGLIVAMLAWSVEMVPLDGSIAYHDGLASLAIGGLNRLMIVAVELAMPVVGGLFLIEVALGLAARFAPQANVFILGMPIKILVSMGLIGVAALVLPGATDAYLAFIEDTTQAVVKGLGG